MTAHNLAEMLSPKVLAVIGASDKASSIPATVTQNVVGAFTGTVHLVNPSGRNLFGRATIKRIADLPDAPDVAIVTAPANALIQVVTDLAARGTKTAVIISDARRGDMPGSKLRTTLRDIGRAGGLRLCGPNALGLAIPHLGLHATIARSLQGATGSIAFVGQSATAAGPLVDWANGHGLGFSHIVSLGDMCDVDYADVIDALAGEARARCIVVFAERLPEARNFFSAVRQASRAKPVLVVKSRAAGEPPERDAVYDAALRRSGALRMRTLEDLFRTIEALLVRLPHDSPPAPGPALAVMANGESIGALAEDTALELGRPLVPLSTETREKLKTVLPPGRPRDNPVDIFADATGERFERALDILLDDTQIDTVLVINGPTGIAPPRETAEAVARSVARARQRPGRHWPWVIASWPGGETAAEAQAIFHEHNIPSFDTPSIAVRAFHALLEKRRLDEAMTATPAPVQAAITARAAAVRDELSTIVEESLKTLSPDLTDKILGEFGFMVIDAPPQDFAWRIALSLDTEMGPVLRFGLHGTVAQALLPEIAGLPPLNLTFARNMLESSPGIRRLRAKQVLSQRTFDTAARSLVQASELIVTLPDIASLDLDGIWFDNDLIKVHRATVSAALAKGDPLARFAFRPYPAELEEHITLDGADHVIRPLRAEDEPALHAFFAKLSPEDMRLRFFQPMRTLSHTLAARLTQLDYDREMAFVLLRDNRPLGAVRLHRDVRGTSGEYAISVRSDLHGKGVGRLLMERMIAYGRKIGLTTVFGLVLGENKPMLGLSRKLGFKAKTEPDDPSVVRVELAL